MPEKFVHVPPNHAHLPCEILYLHVALVSVVLIKEFFDLCLCGRGVEAPPDPAVRLLHARRFDASHFEASHQRHVFGFEHVPFLVKGRSGLTG